MKSPMDRLIQEMLEGNPRAVENLLEQHRSKLKKMVLARIDRRLAARVDASDVVQDALADAARMLTDEIQRRQAVPFYPWLRAIALNRLTDNYRKNIVSRRRSVLREEGIDSQLNDQSAVRLAAQLISPDTSPSGRFNRKERSQRVREALQSLPAEQREVVVLKYLE